MIRITARDAEGRPVANRGVEARSSNSSDSIWIEPLRTDKNGVVDIHVTATEVGTRVLSLSIQSPGQTLTLPQRPSLEFVPGTGTYLEFIETPGTGQAGRPLRPAVKLEIKDDRGNRVEDSEAEVTLHVGGSSTIVSTAVAGIVTFSNVVISEPGESHRLRASAEGLDDALSDPIEIIVGVPSALTFEREPVDVDVGDKISVSVAVRDPAGNVVIGANDLVRIRLYSNPTATKLLGTLEVQAEQGIAHFNDLMINKGSAGYVFTASSRGYQSAESKIFSVGLVDPDPTLSTFTVEEQEVVANGRDRVLLTAKIVDTLGNPLAGYPVRLTASGTGHRFHPTAEGAGEVLDLFTTGTGTITAWISSSVSETKRVALLVGDLFELDGTVTFLPDEVDENLSELVPGEVIATADNVATIEFVVSVKDSKANPVPNAAVALSASGSGNTFEGGAVKSTDADGTATFFLKTTKAETKNVSAKVGGITLTNEVHFVPGAPSFNASGLAADDEANGTEHVVGSIVPKPFRVLLLDAFDNPIPFRDVVFTVTDGRGAQDGTGLASLTAATATTDENGIAETTLTLGVKAGENKIQWNGGWSATQGGDRILTVRGKPDNANKIVVINGADNQAGTAGAVLPTSFQLQTQDQFGNPTGGSVLAFAGDGTVHATLTGAAIPTATIPAWTPTVLDPKATVFWKLKAAVGSNSMVVTTANPVAGQPELSLTLSATGNVGGPSKIVVVGTTAIPGNHTVGTELPQALQVLVTDTNNNPVAGAGVKFTTSAGGLTPGSPVAPTLTVTQPSDANGLASVLYEVGKTAGNQTVTTAGDGWTSSPAGPTFTITAVPDVPTTLVYSAGNNKSGAVGTTVTGLVVKAEDQYGNGVSGVSVSFAVTGSAGPDAAVSAATVTTGATGTASTNLTLGKIPGTYEVTATATGLGSVVFTATATSGNPSSITIVSGDPQSGVVGKAPATGGIGAPLVVEVKDNQGNLLSGRQVNFVVTKGVAGGAAGTTLSAASSTTGANGQASINVTKLTHTVGDVDVTATVNGFASLTQVFKLKATPDVPHAVSHVSGTMQTGKAGAALTDPFVAKVVDQFNNVIPNVTVEFRSLMAGQGSFNPADATTGANGEASSIWTLPAVPGSYAARARVTGASSWASYDVEVEAGDPGFVNKVLGDGASVQVEGTIDLEVEVQDAHNNPLNNVAVSLAATGGHSVPATITTNASGRATATVSLGTSAGDFQVTATVGAINSVFALTALPGAPDALVITGSGQTGGAGASLDDPITAKLVDQHGNPIAGEIIAFAAATPADGALAPATATTDSEGVATAMWTMPTTPGLVTGTATHGSITETFTATVVPGSAATLVATAGQGESGAVEGMIPLEVQVEDAHGNPIENLAVAFSLTSGDATVPASATTDVAGKAGVTVELGTTSGEVVVTASVNGIDLVFNLTANPGDATSIVMESGDGQRGEEGAALPAGLVVKVTDTHGNAVSGVTVDFAGATSGDGTFNPASMTTLADGLASTTWTLPSGAGTRTADATSATITGASVSFTATAYASPSSLTIVSTVHEAEVGGNVAIQVEVQDAAGDPMENLPIVFALASGEGTLSATSVDSDVDGLAGIEVTFGTTAGDVEVTASIGGLSVTFHLNALAGPADTVVIVSGDAQVGEVGTTLAGLLVVEVMDAHGNLVEDASVTFDSADGLPASVTVQTDPSGRASSAFTANEVGTNTVTASIATGTASSVEFTATGLTAADEFVALAGSGQFAAEEMPFGNPLVVRVLDDAQAPIADREIEFSITTGGILAATTATTDADGYATVTVTGDEAFVGDITVTATLSSSSLPAVTFDLTVGAYDGCYAGGLVVVGTDGVDSAWDAGSGVYSAGTFEVSATESNDFQVRVVEAVAGEPALGLVYDAIAISCAWDDGTDTGTDVVHLFAHATNPTLVLNGGGSMPATAVGSFGAIDVMVDAEGWIHLQCAGQAPSIAARLGMDVFPTVLVTGSDDPSWGAAGFCAEPDLLVALDPNLFSPASPPAP